MSQKYLPITINGKKYDLEIRIKDPELIEMYLNNREELTQMIHAGILSTLGDAILPRDFKGLAMRLNAENAKKKIEIISKDI